jgi:HNH endonuclease
MDAELRLFVRQRAENCCEYCRIRQEDSPFVLFHIEHIIPKKHGGNDDRSNLALACYHCNSHKGSNLTGLDPESGNITPLFHPRQEKWEEHFELQEGMLIGRTPIGRVTVRVLSMNAAERVQLRKRLQVH